uniref:Reverse transcriptase domain-containing protein n=1 Tax=Felis catus TaxID=9685 RepID=A0ABI7WFX4_FELCA
MPLQWMTSTPVWVDQWPLPTVKREAAVHLIEEQLQLGHLVPSTSPWNTPIFVIRKKSNKWRLLQDLRAINAVMKPMGALQPGLPSPSAIPLQYQLLVWDIKDCFFTIPLAPGDGEHFAFSLPSTNLQEPAKRYQWKVLPQGMANSLTLCQEFVARAITPFRQSFPHVYCIHYMDDLLLAAETEELLQEAFISLQRCLKAYNLIVAPEKVQREAPFEYLGYLISKSTVRPQKVSIRTGHLTTLNDFQKLLGDINWIRNTLGVTTEQLLPLFNILKGDSSPASPRSLTQEAKEAMRHIEQAIQQAQVTRVDPSQPLYLIILKPQVIPFAILWQSHGPLEWLHLALHSLHVINPLLSMVCLLVIRGRSRAVQLFGHDPERIACAFLTQKLVDAAFAQSIKWQLALANFTGMTAAERRWGRNQEPLLMARLKDMPEGIWRGPDPVLRKGRGYACVFPPDEEAPRWVPLRLLRDITFAPKNGQIDSDGALPEATTAES